MRRGTGWRQRRGAPCVVDVGAKEREGLNKYFNYDQYNLKEYNLKLRLVQGTD